MHHTHVQSGAVLLEIISEMMSEGSSDEAGTGTATCLSTVNRNPVIADGRALLVAYSRKQSVKFTDFKETWQEMQFSFVYW